MLYDPKWEMIYSTKNLANWLSQQPRDQTYHFCDIHNCVVAQYLKAHREPAFLPIERMAQLGWLDIAAAGHWTFGAAAHRARRAAYGPWWVRAARAIRMQLTSSE